MISTSVSIWRSRREQDLDLLAEFLGSRLRSALHGLHVEAITSRKKSAASIQQKLQAGKVASVDEVRDLLGMTVVVLYRSEISKAIDLLGETDLQIDNPGSIEVAPSDFKYHEPKLFVRPPESYLDRNPLLVTECEVQFTTTLQHALDAATHDFDYKGRNYAWSNFRLVAQMRGILEMVDRTIDTIDSTSLAVDPTVTTPVKMTEATAVLAVLIGQFEDELPDDRRRFAETVLGWLNAARLDPGDLELAFGKHPDLVGAKSLDPTSATLGVILRERPNMVDNYEGRLFVSNELRTMCEEAAAVSGSRLVAEP